MFCFDSAFYSTKFVYFRDGFCSCETFHDLKKLSATQLCYAGKNQKRNNVYNFRILVGL